MVNHATVDRARQTLELLSSKWVLDIILQLGHGASRRYGELDDEIAAISGSMLTRTLRRMERDGLVTRAVRPAVPPEVEYRLTPLAESLDVPVTALAAWSEQHWSDVEVARTGYPRRRS